MQNQKLSTPALIISWILQVVTAFILLQTMPYKFLGAPETVALFTAIGAEPTGRYVVGVAELIAGICILWPRFIWFGAALSFAVMVGAVMTHLFKIGIIVHDAAGNVIFGPSLFIEATTAMIFGLIVLIIRRKSIPIIGARL